ncbi:unnamed protein product [Hydatigera taeniaeformis]|uniref:Sulfatase domain-containing protein n=1 Tax=Hydatigena taeniaeformis TaxID=6205 RepID=A0A0R3XBK9_HYDTA|nr:unnamed protein product [Hydatigera taeniaeformis]
MFDNEVSVWLYNAAMQTPPIGELTLVIADAFRHVAPYVHKLASLDANRIDVLMVIAESFNSPNIRTVNFSQGAVGMEKVRPSTLYFARLDAVKDKTKVW